MQRVRRLQGEMQNVKTSKPCTGQREQTLEAIDTESRDANKITDRDQIFRIDDSEHVSPMIFCIEDATRKPVFE
jgi:hypothetical protein